VGLLEISVAAGEAGPVLTLSGEADLTTVAELTDALTAQLAIGARHLTVPLSRLRLLADRALKKRGGGLALARPQPVVARALSLLGVDQAIEICDGMNAGADPDR
jgi:anti-anti-sigma regulatory factor